MSRPVKLIIAAFLFVGFGMLTLHTDWFSGSARTAEARLQTAAEAVLTEASHDRVAVTMHGQLAVISGTARSGVARQEIIRTVKSARWPGGMLAGGVTVVEADGLRVALVSDEPQPPFVWTAEKTAEGPIILAGMVPDEATREIIFTHAKSQFPAGVIDRMSVASNAPPGDWVGAARKCLDMLAQLQIGRATGNGIVFNITGRAASRQIASIVEESLRDMPDGFRGEPNIASPEPPKIQAPYIWGADMEDPNRPVILTGYAPDRETKANIFAHAETLFSQRVIDRMVVASGVPDGNWEEAVKATLTTLASLRTGRARASDLEFQILGTAPGEASAANARAVMAGLGDDFTGTTRLDIAPPPQVEEIDECQALFDNATGTTTINFETAKATIRADSHALLDQLANTARQCSAFNVTITGHTDNIGAAALNQNLSEARARAVADYLIAAGIDAGRLTASGVGEAMPVADNATSLGRARNRRIEFTIEQ